MACGSALLRLTLAWAVLGCSLGVPTPSTHTQTQGAEGQPKITYSKETVAKEGDRVKLDCGVEGVDLSGVNGFSVSWSKIDIENPVNSLPISGGNRILLFSQKYELEHPEDTYHYSLIIKSVKEEDAGVYRCTVDFGDSQKINADVTVSLQAAPYFTDNITKSLTVTEGDSISIDCQPGGSPKPDVYWEKANDVLPNFGGKFFKSNQLDLPHVQKNHSGRYICYADNGIGESATSEIELEVQFVPEMDIPANRIFTTTNDEAKMECTVFSFPPADVSWYKDEEPILGGANTRIQTTELKEDFGVKSTLSVVSVTPDDLGVYSCRAANSVGIVEKSVQLTIKSPPIIVKQSRKEVLYDLEESKSRSALPIALECQADGAPSPNYRWTRNGAPLVWQSDYRFSLDEENGNLYISEPTLEDNGMYQCFAYNDLGTAAADPIYLLNVSSIYFSNDGDSSDTYNLIAELGRPYKLTCPKAFAYPEPELTWVRSVEQAEGIELEFVKDERSVVDPSGGLWFTHITAEDDTEKNGFQFMCMANTPFRPYDYSIASVVHIQVKDPEDGAHNLKEDTINVESFAMYTSEKSVSFKADKENSLWCIYGGEPVPEIKWHRVDTEDALPNTRVTVKNFGRTLVFADTKLEDAGEYACTVNNGVGTEKTSVMRVVVEQAPVFQEPLESQTVQEGATVTFTCETNSTDDVMYTWMLNGRRLSPRDRHLRRTIEGSRLVISGVTPTDIGNYACNATSTLGYAYGQAVLNVLPADKQSSHGGICTGVEKLHSEMAELKQTVEELRILITAQKDLTQLTHDSITTLTEDLVVSRASTQQTEAPEEEELEITTEITSEAAM